VFSKLAKALPDIFNMHGHEALNKNSNGDDKATKWEQTIITSCDEIKGRD